MKNLQKAQIFTRTSKLFQRYPWLLLSLLAALQMSAVLVYLRLSKPNSAASQPAESTDANRPVPSVPFPSSLAELPSAPTGKSATKSASKTSASPTPGQTTAAPSRSTSQSASQSAGQTAPAASAKPALTAEQQRLNEQSKAEFLSSASFDSLVEMHVAIAEGVGSLTVGSSVAVAVLDQNRNPLTTLEAGQTYTVQPSSTGLTLAGTDLPAVVLLEPADSAPFNLGSRTYRGRLLLANDDGKLWAVNLVNLRSYLHSVVASEVSPSWPPEALKAQAVAARSYALTYYFKPMSSLFHLGATEYYQVYSGIDREASETNQAVDATAGEYVSYKGGIVESLYAASDDIVMEAFQGRGMSQLGALNLAQQGYSYQQILGGYYPGTGLGRMVISP